MSRTMFTPAALTIGILFCLLAGGFSYGEPPMPQAPASFSWLPHGYGGNMYVTNTLRSTFKSFHGFRSSPEHIGCWSQPLWGWDVNGYYRGPNVPDPDPGAIQLPIGLLYPENGPPIPPAPPVRKVSLPAR
jgi:hypothetical protein